MFFMELGNNYGSLMKAGGNYGTLRKAGGNLLI